MSLRFNVYLAVCSILLLKNHVNCQEPLLEISQGILRGRIATNHDGGIFYSFQSIPYGQPPLNELRYKATLPANGWEGIRDATTDVPTCWQFLGEISSGQEDCLYLNVYTPELPNENSTVKPVMVFIHGGGFTAGSAQTSWYGPEFLLTKDIVLVVINYRLGLLGFLNLDDPELDAPGNAGMKDQVLALKWVQDNVERFGGDPNDVTIFGESGGAMSVHLHMLSSMSAGLFHKGIVQSGVAITPFINGVKNNGLMVAEQLGIQTGNWSEMLATLREAPVEDLVMATQVFIDRYVTFVMPSVEGPSNYEENFLPIRAIDIIKSGNHSQVPLLIGITDAEGLMYQRMSLEATGENLLIEDYSYFVPHDFEIASGSEEEEEVIQKVKEFYYGDSEPTREDIGPAVQLYTDFDFGYPAHRAILEHLKFLTTPIYYYILSAETELNFMKLIEPRLREFPGASHGDDLGYMFHTSLMPSVIEAGSPEDLGWRNVVNLWTNFAIYGNPTPDDSDGLVWLPVTENAFNYVDIGTNGTYSLVNPTPENMQFWQDLYDEYYPTNY